MDKRTNELNHLLDQIAEYVKFKNAIASKSDKTRTQGIIKLFHKACVNRENSGIDSSSSNDNRDNKSGS